MNDSRKNVKVIPTVKYDLEALKKTLDVSSESDVILYLVTYYSRHSDQITLKEHREIMSTLDMSNKQLVF